MRPPPAPEHAGLVLTHIPPWTDADRNAADARAVYPGPVELAAPGAVYEL